MRKVHLTVLQRSGCWQAVYQRFLDGLITKHAKLLRASLPELLSFDWSMNPSKQLCMNMGTMNQMESVPFMCVRATSGPRCASRLALYVARRSIRHTSFVARLVQ